MFPFKDTSKCRVTCEYGRKGSWSSGKHDGIDIVSDSDKSILAVTSGKVIRSGINTSWGEYVVIQMSNNKSIVYAHMVKGSRKVSVNQTVKEGTIIGTMGSTGHSTGAHLHIEIQPTYYKSGFTENIAEYLGIKNVVGSVTFIKNEVKEDEELSKPENITILVDGKNVEVNAVNVDGSNYIKLRDVEKIANVKVDFNGKNPTVTKL